MPPIYLDHNASTPPAPEVIEAMSASLAREVGNPSSLHAFGQASSRALDQARRQVARLIGATASEIVFTSGGTESDNLALLGVVPPNRARPVHVVTSQVEHQAVRQPLSWLEAQGVTVTRVGVDDQGRVDPAAVIAALRDDTALVSVMLANNDVGTLQPVAEIAAAARARGALVHTDAAQAVGRVPVDVDALGLDLLTLSGHKLRGPKGVGALYVRRGVELAPILRGGRQEAGLRAGSQNVPGIVGLGVACELARERLSDQSTHLARLRDRFEREVLACVPGARVNGAGADRLPNTSNLSFDDVDGDLLVINLDLAGLAASTGSACSASSQEPSYVLLAMGQSAEEARSSVRLSFGVDDTGAEVDGAVAILVEQVRIFRG
jgi:cysteine desulfurase